MILCNSDLRITTGICGTISASRPASVGAISESRPIFVGAISRQMPNAHLALIHRDFTHPHQNQLLTEYENKNIIDIKSALYYF